MLHNHMMLIVRKASWELFLFCIINVSCAWWYQVLLKYQLVLLMKCMYFFYKAFLNLKICKWFNKKEKHAKTFYSWFVFSLDNAHYIIFVIYLYKTDQLNKNQLWLIQTEICITYTMRSKLDLLYTYLIDSQNKFALNRVCMTAQRVYFFQYLRFLWNLKEDLDTEQKKPPIFDQFKIIEVKFENSPQSFIPCLKFFSVRFLYY